MKHFADLNGLICWVKENGESNHPAITSGEQVAKIKGNKILFIKSDGLIQDEFILWDHLTALAAAIERPIHRTSPWKPPLCRGWRKRRIFKNISLINLIFKTI